MTTADGSAIFEADHYAECRRNRVANLLAHVDASSLAGASVLELGCGTGEIGEAFARLGCRVVSVDAVAEHIAALKSKFPQREALVVDLERLDPAVVGRFDAVLAFGVLYHLATPTALLRACAAISDRLFLETVVLDTAEARYDLVTESGPDQSFSGRGCRPSPEWLRLVLTDLGYELTDISSSAANWGGPCPSVYDWTPRNDGAWERDNARLRKMYVCVRR